MSPLGDAGGAQPSALEWRRRLGGRELSSRELVTHYIGRIHDSNPTLNAVVALNAQGALAEADLADRALRDGDRRPLLGVPITVKDVLHVAGMPTSGGSWARPLTPAPADATTVNRLRQAGAIVLAKTNAPEASSSAETHNARYGRTNHPSDSSRTPGGSSGGEAALIGADSSIAGVGTDGGSSIRAPAHFCGIVGIRPTAGRTPETGIWPPTRSSGLLDLTSVGPLARYVEDLDVMLRVMAGPDGVDPFAVPVTWRDPAGLDVSSLRVAFYDHDEHLMPTPETRAAVQAAATAFAEAGCEVVEVAPEGFTEAGEVFLAALAADGGAHIATHCSGDSPHVPQFEQFLESLQAARPATVEEVYTRHGRLFDLRSRIRRFVGEYDVILCPVVSGPAPRHGEVPAGGTPGMDLYGAYNYTFTYAVAGLPAATVPVGAEDGLPIGVQIIGSPFREDIVLAASSLLERAFGGFNTTIALRAKSQMSTNRHAHDSPSPLREATSDVDPNRGGPAAQ